MATSFACARPFKVGVGVVIVVLIVRGVMGMERSVRRRIGVFVRTRPDATIGARTGATGGQSRRCVVPRRRWCRSRCGCGRRRRSRIRSVVRAMRTLGVSPVQAESWIDVHLD